MNSKKEQEHKGEEKIIERKARKERWLIRWCLVLA
jgi:hypothetical protein